jgi:ribosomal protein S18 acetylase RimI-like enzyme
MTITVKNIIYSEVDQASETLYQAFKSDKMMQWLFVNKENYDNNAKALFKTWLQYGIRYGVALRTEQYEAIAIRRKPGDTKFGFWRMLRSGMLKTPKLLSKEGMKRLEILGRFCSQAVTEYMPNQLFWHCWVLGTLPEKQKQGFARALMNKTFELAANDNLPCYLETVAGSAAENVHKHVGYKPVTTFVLPECEIKIATMLYKTSCKA